MTTTLYIRNRREAAIAACIARELGRHTSIRDIYKHDRYLINVADRLFGASPDKIKFVMRVEEAVKAIR